MPALHFVFPVTVFLVIRLAIACFILAIGLRTWLVMGLIEPLSIAGSSMVPTISGTSLAPQCPDCGYCFSVGVEFAANTSSATCPQCANPDVSIDSLLLQRADRLWIDRTSLLWRKPERWELIVARNPQNADEMCIKRIVGLPGERIELRDGNVLVDGVVVVKSIDQQRVLRRQIHKEQILSERILSEHASTQRWQPEQKCRWKKDGANWQHAASEIAVSEINVPNWLRYQHPHARPVTDDVAYNVGLTRQLNLVDEFMLTVELTAHGKGTLSLAIDDGTSTAQLDLRFPDGQLRVNESKHHTSFTLQLSDFALERLARGEVQLEFTNFDQQLMLVIDNRVEIRRPWPRTQAVGVDAPLSIGVRGLDVQLGQLAVYRDTYHSNRAVGTPPPRLLSWHLGKDEYFLLGDNAPVSLDSRLWGPGPESFFLGKPILSGR